MRDGDPAREVRSLAVQSEPSIAVLVPCLNEEAAIGKVVSDFRAALPTATVYVYDNNSTDKTIEVATAAGAVVRRERRPGKGNVVRRMFQDIEADIYIMVDGDDTYDAAVAPQLVARMLDEQLDMVVGRRIETHQAAYRAGHRLGNRVLTGLVARLSGAQIVDMLSGYRVFSRRFVKSFPSSSREFEIETELTVHAMQMRMAVAPGTRVPRWLAHLDADREPDAQRAAAPGRRAARARAGAGRGRARDPRDPRVPRHGARAAVPDREPRERARGDRCDLARDRR